VDPCLAIPLHPTSAPAFTWDLLYHPTAALLESPSISPRDLRRCAFRTSATSQGPSLQSLVLIFPLLPMEIEIGVSSSGASRRASGSIACLTVGDVLEGLYRGLRAPIEPHEFMALSEPEKGTLFRACEVRCRCLPEDARSRHALRKIDYLARRRRFLGIRPAMPYELPKRRKLGEVYVVEVG
ncbi:hypothetical protein L226DRAFT_444211, partial [Lentinus tigrinus ALCF2SS1-7]